MTLLETLGALTVLVVLGLAAFYLYITLCSPLPTAADERLVQQMMAEINPEGERIVSAYFSREAQRRQRAEEAYRFLSEAKVRCAGDLAKAMVSVRAFGNYAAEVEKLHHAHDRAWSTIISTASRLYGSAAVMKALAHLA